MGKEIEKAWAVLPTYALTTATFARRALFQKTANAELLVRILFHYRDQGRYRLHGFAVMPEHVHVLLTAGPDQTIERCVQCIKGSFSHELKGRFSGTVWQTGFHEHRVREKCDFENQLAYIARNPTRRQLKDWRFVHTCFGDRIDPMPDSFRANLRG